MSNKSSKITSEFKSSFMKTKIDYDTYSQAIKLAKLNGVADNLVQELINNKQRLKQECADNNKSTIRSMNLNNNIVSFGDSWYGVRYTNDKGEVHLKVDVLNDKDIPILQRDCRRERDLLRSDLDNLLPGCINMVKLDIYKKKIHENALYLIQECCGVALAEENDSDAMTVSSHAGERYVQRKLNIGVNDKAIARNHYRANIEELQPRILKDYESAELLWTGEDGISYSFDNLNTMYVVGNNNIITLYESDFGFSQSINRSIVYQQVDILKASYEHMKETVLESGRNRELDLKELERITDQIKVLEARIDELRAEQDILKAERQKSIATIRVAKDRFNQEFNKLFKKWDE